MYTTPNLWIAPSDGHRRTREVAVVEGDKAVTRAMGSSLGQQKRKTTIAKRPAPLEPFSPVPPGHHPFNLRTSPFLSFRPCSFNTCFSLPRLPGGRTERDLHRTAEMMFNGH